MRKISDKRESDITKKELVYDIMDEKIGVISDLSWKEKRTLRIFHTTGLNNPLSSLNPTHLIFHLHKALHHFSLSLSSGFFILNQKQSLFPWIIFMAYHPPPFYLFLSSSFSPNSFHILLFRHIRIQSCNTFWRLAGTTKLNSVGAVTVMGKRKNWKP